LVIKKVLLSPSFTGEAASLIQTYLNNFKCKQIKSWPEESDAEALIVRSKDRVDLGFSQKFKNLKIVVTATSGFDHIDLKLTKTTNVTFCHSPNANVTSASEATLWHMLNLLKNGSTLSKNWKWRSNELLGKELEPRHMCLIGLGRIGKSVAKKAQAFGCNVSACDPYLSEVDFAEAGVSKVSFEEALRSSDILSLHCPLTSETRGLIKANELKMMKKDAILINCARGGLVSEADLISHIQGNDSFSAGLDVFENEPLAVDSPLRQSSQVSLSPHIGGFTREAQNKSALEAAQQVKNWFEQDQPVLSLLPPTDKWAKYLRD
jgi:D-3-phosphoglycerate dehydrogenase